MKSWIVIGVLACAAAGWGFVGYGKRVATNEKYLAAPAVNDKYIADLDLMGGGKTGGAWGVMKLVRVGSNEMEFAISKKAYTKSKGPERDLDRGDGESSDYYEEKRSTIPMAALKAAVKNNSILYIRR